MTHPTPDHCCPSCDILHALRQEGWAVAVHNDYRQDGKSHTFWLFTKDGSAVKGEGLNDVTALTFVAEQLFLNVYDTPNSKRPSTGLPEPRLRRCKQARCPSCDGYGVVPRHMDDITDKTTPVVGCMKCEGSGIRQVLPADIDKESDMTTLRKKPDAVEYPSRGEALERALEQAVIAKSTAPVPPGPMETLEDWASHIAVTEFPTASLGRIERGFGISDTTLTVRDTEGTWLLEVGVTKENTPRRFRVLRDYGKGPP